MGNRLPALLSFGHFPKIRNLGTSATGLSPIRSLKSGRSSSVRARAPRPSVRPAWSRGAAAGWAPGRWVEAVCGGDARSGCSYDVTTWSQKCVSQRFHVFVKSEGQSEGGDMRRRLGPWWPASPRAWCGPPCWRDRRGVVTVQRARGLPVPPRCPFLPLQRPVGVLALEPRLRRVYHVGCFRFRSAVSVWSTRTLPSLPFPGQFPGPPNHVFLWAVVSVSVSVAVLAPR